MCPDELSELGSGACVLQESQTQSAPAWNELGMWGEPRALFSLCSSSGVFPSAHGSSAADSTPWLPGGVVFLLERFFFSIIIVVILTRQSCQLRG